MLKRSSQPLKALVNRDSGNVTIYLPDQTALVLVIDKVKSVVGPRFLDLLDIILQGHLCAEYEEVATSMNPCIPLLEPVR